jgi:hypothetical protein
MRWKVIPSAATGPSRRVIALKLQLLIVLNPPRPFESEKGVVDGHARS